MSHHKRRKPRRKVKCTICTPGRMGNSLKEAPKRIRLLREPIRCVTTARDTAYRGVAFRDDAS